MSSNLVLRDGDGVKVSVHTIEDATSVHFMQSVPTDIANNTATIVSSGQAVAGTMGALVVSQRDALPAGTNHLGKVSVDNTVAVSISPTQGNIPVSVAGTVNVSLGALTNNIPVSVAGGRVSVQGVVTVAPFTNTGSAIPTAAHFVGGTDGTNLRGFFMDTTGALVVTSIKDDVSIAPQTLLVHVCNAAPGGSGALTVSVGGNVSTQGVPIVGSDGTDARRILTDTAGAVKIGGFTTTPEYVFTRPTDVAPYTIGDLVANSTVAGTVVPMSFPVSRLTGGGGSFMIRRARLITPGDNRTTDRSYRLHFWNIATTLSATNGDNGVFAPTHVSDYCGYIDIPMHLSAAAGAAGVGVPGGGSDINIVLAAGQTSISAFLEARTSILPASGVAYHTIIEIIPD